jgi:hypothetical protein
MDWSRALNDKQILTQASKPSDLPVHPISYRALPTSLSKPHATPLQVFSEDAIGRRVWIVVMHLTAPSSLAIYHMFNTQTVRPVQQLAFRLQNSLEPPASFSQFMSVCLVSRLIMFAAAPRRFEVWPLDPAQSYVACTGGEPLCSIQLPARSAPVTVQLITLGAPPPIDAADNRKSAEPVDLKSDAASSEWAVVKGQRYAAISSQVPPLCLACIGLNTGEMLVVNAHTGKMRQWLFGPPPSVEAAMAAAASTSSAGSIESESAAAVWREEQVRGGSYNIHFGGSPYLQRREHDVPDVLKSHFPQSRSAPANADLVLVPHFAVRSRTQRKSSGAISESDISPVNFVDIVNGKISKQFEPVYRPANNNRCGGHTFVLIYVCVVFFCADGCGCSTIVWRWWTLWCTTYSHKTRRALQKRHRNRSRLSHRPRKSRRRRWMRASRSGSLRLQRALWSRPKKRAVRQRLWQTSRVALVYAP